MVAQHENCGEWESDDSENKWEHGLHGMGFTQSKLSSNNRFFSRNDVHTEFIGSPNGMLLRPESGVLMKAHIVGAGRIIPDRSYRCSKFEEGAATFESGLKAENDMRELPHLYFEATGRRFAVKWVGKTPSPNVALVVSMKTESALVEATETTEVCIKDTDRDGASWSNVEWRDGNPFGSLVIVSVEPNSVWAKCSPYCMSDGDVIVRVNGVDFENKETMLAAMKGHASKDELRLTVNRAFTFENPLDDTRASVVELEENLWSWLAGTQILNCPATDIIQRCIRTPRQAARGTWKDVSTRRFLVQFFLPWKQMCANKPTTDPPAPSFLGGMPMQEVPNFTEPAIDEKSWTKSVPSLPLRRDHMPNSPGQENQGLQGDSRGHSHLERTLSLDSAAPIRQTHSTDLDLASRLRLDAD
jgi:hypothetical protein